MEAGLNVKYVFADISISPRDIAAMAPGLEAAGYDGLQSAETSHDPFVSLAAASQRTTRLELRTGVAIALARNPMSTAMTAYDLQLLSVGRFSLALGTQLKAHITRLFFDEVTRPALSRGRSKAGKPMAGFQLHFFPIVATGRNEAELSAAISKARQQVAFYTATPTYARLLELHGYAELREELQR